MVDLTPQEQKVLAAMKSLGANAPEKLKTSDQIADTANLAKGIANNAMVGLCNKGVVKRVAREKAAGYYVLPGF